MREIKSIINQYNNPLILEVGNVENEFDVFSINFIIKDGNTNVGIVGVYWIGTKAYLNIHINYAERNKGYFKYTYDLLFSEINEKTFYASIDDDNLHSIHVHEKYGFKKISESNGVIVYAMDRSDHH